MNSLSANPMTKALKTERMQIFTHGVIDNKSTTVPFFSNTMYDRHLLGVIRQFV
jgi:hypothetical protein